MTPRRQIVPGVGSGLTALGTQRIILMGFALMVVLTGLGLSHLASIKARMVNLLSESNVKAESVYQARSFSRAHFASCGQRVVLHDPFERDAEYMRFQAQAAEFIRARELIRRDEQLHAQVLALGRRKDPLA